MENFNKIPNLICIGQYNECIHYIKNLNINTLSINNDLDHYILINIISNFINQNVMNQKKNIQIELTNFCTELFANFLDECISNNSEITYIFLTEHERYIPDSIKNKTIINVLFCFSFFICIFGCPNSNCSLDSCSSWFL